MKRSLILASLLLLGIFVGTGFALPVGSISDTYLHPNDAHNSIDDVIGTSNIFDIYGHKWVNNQMLNIYLSWNIPGGSDLNSQHLNAMLGDVFIYDSSGASLEYFVPVRDHDSVLQGEVYQVVGATQALSNFYYPAYPILSYGEDEIVTADSTQGSVGSALVSFDDNTGYYYNTIAIAFLEDHGFYGRDIRFAFTCGNDVLAPASVPEPSTMLLFGLGLIGLAGLGRRKLKKSKDSLPKTKP